MKCGWCAFCAIEFNQLFLSYWGVDLITKCPFKMALLTPYWGLDGILVFLSLVTAAYMYMTRKFKYWEKQGVMEFPPTPFLGNFGECVMQKKSPPEFIKEMYDKGKGLPYVGVYIFDKPALVVRDPELIKQVLVKDFQVFTDKYASVDVKDRIGFANVFLMKNPGWKVLRAKLTPFFTSGKLKKMQELMLIVADDLDKHLETRNLDGAGKVVEMKDLCANFTTDLIVSTAFGVRVNSLNNPNAEFRQQGRKIFDYSMLRGFELLTVFFIPDIVRYTHPQFFSKEFGQFLRHVFWDVFNAREKSGEKRTDLIDLLIDLRQKYGHDTDMGGFKFDGDDLVGQAAAFFTGGFETSSTTMSFTLYELALNQDIQRTLRKEILDALQESGGKITYEMLTTLPYLDMVVSETLRKYPPLGFLDRRSNADYTLPNSDVVLKKGTPIFIPMMGLHYDPQYYPEPEKYDPERFSEENKQKRPNNVYFPFGDGPRLCIGMRLGLIQTKLGVMQLLRKYEVTPCKQTPIPMQLDPKGLTTTSLGGLYLNVRKITTDAG